MHSLQTRNITKKTSTQIDFISMNYSDCNIRKKYIYKYINKNYYYFKQKNATNKQALSYKKDTIPLLYTLFFVSFQH